jgi:hypothetical protein
MMNPGLALEQAPPFSVPLRFFLTAPWFLAVAGLMAAWQPNWTGGHLAPTSLALTHLVTLGFLGMAMLGAMTQMLPVVAGAPVSAVRPMAALSHACLAMGTPLLAWGLSLGGSVALEAASLLLSLGLAAFIVATGISLSRGHSLDTLRAMALALAGLAITLMLGLILTGWLAGMWMPTDPLNWLTRHALAGLGGWIGVLVMGTAWQVVPMLQVTPPYPSRLTRALLISASLSLMASLLLPAPWRILGEVGLSLTGIVFALVTLDLQRRRKRKIPDVGLSFWRLGMICLIAAAALFPLADSEAMTLMAGLLFLIGFAASVINGMLYKIVPFLAWFHLQAQKGIMASGLPSMKDYLPEAAATGQFRLHLLALPCLLAAPFQPVLAIPGGVFLAGSSAWLGWNLVRAVRLYLSRDGLL